MIYLDNAATTHPKPEAVYKAVNTCMRTFAANPGRSGHKMALQASREIYQTREEAADFFHAKDPFRMIFTSNATESLNLAIKGILKPGDHVITSAMEHNSVIRPLYRLKEIGVETTVVACDQLGRLNPEDVRKALGENTRLVVMTHASNVTGTIMPINAISEICKENQIHFLLDASQTAGVLPLDVESLSLSMMATAGHKGLLGPQGTGLLYVAEGVPLRPLKEGGTGSRSEELTQPDIMPDLFESGTLNTPGIAGLGAGITYVKENREKIYLHEKKLTEFLIEELQKIPGVILYGANDQDIERAGVVSLNLLDLPSTEVSYLLDSQFDICSRSGLHCAPLAHKTIGTLQRGTVRLSVGYETTENEIVAAIDAIKEICRKQ